jgi:hypothetical protein
MAAGGCHPASRGKEAPVEQVPTEGIRLHFAEARPTVTDLAEINATLHPIGFRAWPIDLTAAPESVRHLLALPALTDPDVATLRDQYLLSRARMLEIIDEAGRHPQVPGGGEMSTLDATNGVTYPQLYMVGAGVDYSRFDRFHINKSDEGPGTDEVMQILSGGGIRVLQHLPGAGEFTVTFDCVGDERGWGVTYDGGRPHIGSFTGAQPGTKILVQVMGPPRWTVHYVDP